MLSARNICALFHPGRILPDCIKIFQELMQITELYDYF